MTPSRRFESERQGCLLIPSRECLPVSKPQKIVDLALSPAMILGCKRIDASIDADVANKEVRALDKVRYLINGSPAEATCGSRHRRAPLLPRQRYLAFGNKSARPDLLPVIPGWRFGPQLTVVQRLVTFRYSSVAVLFSWPSGFFSVAPFGRSACFPHCSYLGGIHVALRAASLRFSNER
jgi:hypothetical protein